MPALSTATKSEACEPIRGRGRRAAPQVSVELSPQSIERIAVRVARLLEERRGDAGPELIAAGELARRLGVERPWVYRHRELLGGMRIGAGPRARWRFDYRRSVEAMRRLEGAGGGEGR